VLSGGDGAGEDVPGRICRSAPAGVRDRPSGNDHCGAPACERSGNAPRER
jgi:hypothetical protein